MFDAVSNMSVSTQFSSILLFIAIYIQVYRPFMTSATLVFFIHVHIHSNISTVCFP